jgi:hypothetical protein
MSSEPIERRVSYLGDRLRGRRCQLCGKEYFEIGITAVTAAEKALAKWRTLTFSTKREGLNSARL